MHKILERKVIYLEEEDKLVLVNPDSGGGYWELGTLTLIDGERVHLPDFFRIFNITQMSGVPKLELHHWHTFIYRYDIRPLNFLWEKI